MKNNLTKPGLFLGIVLLMFAGCNFSTKTNEDSDTATDGQEEYSDVETFDAMKNKDQIVEAIRQIPSEKEVVTLLNEAGASYILDLTVPTEKAEKLMSKSDQGFGLGLYSFDLLYASIYNRGDMAAEISDVLEQLINKLGLTDELVTSQNYLERIKANTGNEDSLNYLVTKDLEHFNQQMSAGDQPGVYALAMIGSNVEALYVLSQTTLLANNNEEMLNILNGQKERVKQVFNLLELMSKDEDIKPYYEQFKPVVKIFEENPEITETELAEIGAQMDKVRKSILD